MWEALYWQVHYYLADIIMEIVSLMRTIHLSLKIVGEELYLNRNATVIEGKVIEGKKGDQFKMLVDTETGILLHFLVMNNAGEIIQEIKVQEIEIDKNKDTEPFIMLP